MVDDARRRFLHEGAAAGLGAEVADALMEHLPPGGWSELATKADVDNSAALLKADVDNSAALLRADVERSAAVLTAAFHRDMVRQTWVLAGTVLAAMGTVAGLLR